MGARGKKRKRSDGTHADNRKGREQPSTPTLMRRLGIGMSGTEPPCDSIIYRVVECWMPLYARELMVDGLRDLINGALRNFDRNRRQPGQHYFLSAIAFEVYSALMESREEERGVDLSAFVDFRRLTIKQLASRLQRSPGAITTALRLLREHGFAERKARGSSFEYRLAIPAGALVELGERYILNAPSQYNADQTDALGKALVGEFSETSAVE